AERIAVTVEPGISLVDSALVDDTHAVVNENPVSGPSRLALVDLTTGTSTPLTQNLSVFTGVNMTADRRAAVSTRIESQSGIWIGEAPAGALNEAVLESAAQAHAVALDNQGGIAYQGIGPRGTALYALAPGQRTPV